MPTWHTCLSTSFARPLGLTNFAFGANFLPLGRVQAAISTRSMRQAVLGGRGCCGYPRKLYGNLLTIEQKMARTMDGKFAKVVMKGPNGEELLNAETTP